MPADPPPPWTDEQWATAQRIDLAVASDVHVRLLQLSIEPRYVLRISERFLLRIKQLKTLFVLKAGAHK